MPNEVGDHCTTRQQKTHGTKAEVVYPWHPWFGKEVIVDRAVHALTRTYGWAQASSSDLFLPDGASRWLLHLPQDSYQVLPHNTQREQNNAEEEQKK